ncbi:MAG: helix-hairpin-helix domain-containing protein [Candidatus Thorarchaeota archaeon]
MLEYRNFPYQKALFYWSYAPVSACLASVVLRLTSRSMFGSLDQLGLVDELVMLGTSAGAAGLILVLSAIFICRVSHSGLLMGLSAVVPILLLASGSAMGYPSPYTPYLEWSIAVSAFAGLALFSLCWLMQLNTTVTIRYRGRIVGVYLVILISVLAIIDYWSLGNRPSWSGGPNIPETIALVSIVVSLLLRPWRWESHALACSGNVRSYFIPTVLLMASYMLWYFATETKLSERAYELGHDFISLADASGLATYEPILLILGVLSSSLLADLVGRRRIFSTAVFLLALLAIFGSAFYGPAYPTPNYAGLFVVERLVEGYLLGFCVFLVWSEQGPPKTRALRVALIWCFFVGYLCLFWAVSLHAFGWTVPAVVAGVGNEFGILLALMALYTSTSTEELLGREIEMEDISIDFDEHEIRKTVESLVPEEDIASVRAQLELAEATEEISEEQMREILGETSEGKSVLRTIPGVGPRMEERLRQAGYDSPLRIAGESPSKLSSKVRGITPRQAEKIIEGAREVVRNMTNSDRSTSKK